MQNTGRPNYNRPKKKKNSDETATLIIPQITPEIIARAREAMAQGMSAEEAAKLATAEAAEAAAAKTAARSRAAEKPRQTVSEAAVSVQPRMRSGVHPGVAVRARPQESPKPITFAGAASAALSAPVPEPTRAAETTSTIDSTSTLEATSSLDTTSTLEATSSFDTTSTLEATSSFDTTSTLENTSALEPTSSIEATSTVQTSPSTGSAKPKAKNRVKKSTKQTSSKAGPRSRRQAERELFKSIHDDHLWLNNPMMVRGLGLAPAVVAATDGDNALMLCVAALCLITLTRVLSVALCHLTDNRHRALIYAYSAALVYIPTYILLFELFGSSLTILGIYLPLLAVEPVVLKRVENDSLETVGEALHRGINNSAGYCIALMLVGIVREFLASGTFFGNKLVSFSLLPLAAQPAGGFILIGVICAVWTAVGGTYVHYKREEVRHLYADADTK